MPDDRIQHKLTELVHEMRDSNIRFGPGLRLFRRQWMLSALARHGGNQCKVAQELGVHRNTVGRELDRLGIDTGLIRRMNRARRQQLGEKKPSQSIGIQV